MITQTGVRELLKNTLSILPLSEDDIYFKGLTSEVTDRIVELKKSALKLKNRYGTLEKLKGEIKSKGVTPDDHILYTNLLEWRAINHELSKLVEILGSI